MKLQFTVALRAHIMRENKCLFPNGMSSLISVQISSSLVDMALFPYKPTIFSLMLLPTLINTQLLTKESSSTTQCARKIINKNFRFARTLVLSDNNENSVDFNVISGAVRVDYNHLSLLETIFEKINNVILNYHDINLFNVSVTFLKNTYCFDSRANYLVIANSIQDIQLISNILWTHRLYKSAIIHENNGTVGIFQIDLKNSKCGAIINYSTVGDCDRIAVNDLYNPKMRSCLKNCSLKVIYSRSPPWIIDETSGIFGQALTVFAEINGLRLVYMPENPKYADELKDSYSFEAVKSDFESGYADVYLGLGNNLPYAVMETSTTIYDDNLYWVVPKAPRMPYWKAMIQYFPLYFWLSILLLFATISAVFCVISVRFRHENQFDDVGENLLYLFSITLNFPVWKTAVDTTLRCFVTVYCWVSLLVCIMLQARLFDVFSNPVYENDITDLEKLLESGLPLRFLDGMGVLFLFTGPLNQRVFDTYVATNRSLIDGLDELIVKRDFASIIDTGVLVMRPNIRQTVNIFDVAYFQTCFYMRQYHELFELLNKSVKRIVESGFVSKFVSDMRWKYFLSYMRHDEMPAFFQLSVNHFQAAFMLLLYGWVLAVAIFIGEHCHRIVWKIKGRL